MKKMKKMSETIHRCIVREEPGSYWVIFHTTKEEEFRPVNDVLNIVLDTRRPSCDGHVPKAKPGVCECYIPGDHFDYMPDGYGRCNGTKEMEICSCGGDRKKCNFYREEDDGK